MSGDLCIYGKIIVKQIILEYKTARGDPANRGYNKPVDILYVKYDVDREEELEKDRNERAKAPVRFEVKRAFGPLLLKHADVVAAVVAADEPWAGAVGEARARVTATAWATIEETTGAPARVKAII